MFEKVWDVVRTVASALFGLLVALAQTGVVKDILQTLFVFKTVEEKNRVKGLLLIGGVVTAVFAMLVKPELAMSTLYYLSMTTLLVVTMMKIFTHESLSTLILWIIMAPWILFETSGLTAGVGVAAVLGALEVSHSYYFRPAAKVIPASESSYRNMSIIPSLVLGVVVWLGKGFLIGALVAAVLILTFSYGLRFLYMNATEVAKLAEVRDALRQEEAEKAAKAAEAQDA